MQIAVAQRGARKNYVAPAAFAQRRMLARLYTDFYAKPGWLSVCLQHLARLSGSGLLKAIAGRQAEGIPVGAVAHYPLQALYGRYLKRRGLRRNDLLTGYLLGGKAFCERILRDGFGKADGVYAFSSAALELFEHARKNELICVLDHETPPVEQEHRLVREQWERYPQWSVARTATESMKAYAERQRKESELAQLIVCPSSFARDLVVSAGAVPEKTVTIPFAVDSRFFLEGPRASECAGDRKLRVLFVGNDPVRKGMGDLIMAFRELHTEQIEARGIGAWQLTDEGLAAARSVMQVLGAVPRTDIASHYEWADVFVFPTVSDALGIVILEAMAAGLPVITTTNSGGPDILRDGKDGFVVPVHQPDMIAEKLDLLASDRERCTAMGQSARVRAREFSLESYACRLCRVVQAADERTSA